MSRRGFSLVELLVATIVFAFLGVALARMLVSDSRFVSAQEAMMFARQTARAARNTMAVELRMIGDGGLLAAAAESVTVRVPYAFGVTCGANASGTLGSLAPPDSLMYASALIAGIALRDPLGAYTFVDGTSAAPSSDMAACTAQGGRVVPGGMLVTLQALPAALTPPPGRIFYLYETVTYRFSPSAELPGRTALWRRSGAAAEDELVAPFDTTARFAFLVGPNSNVVDTPPADLTTVRGLELRLVGASVLPPQGSSDPETFDLVTHVPFTNMAN